MKALILILTIFCNIIAAFSQSQATPTTLVTRPQMNESSTLMMNHTAQQKNETRLDGSCVYMVTIKTSCSSPSYTTDEISTLFGDAHGTEVYVPRLDDADYGTFEQCSTNAFEIIGPCSDKICKLYLFRNGSDGWIPESVTAYDYNYPPITFHYNIYIPDDAGYGYNYCD